jgi:hypothetical protein
VLQPIFHPRISFPLTFQCFRCSPLKTSSCPCRVSGKQHADRFHYLLDPIGREVNPSTPQHLCWGFLTGLTLSGALYTALKGGAWRRRMGQYLTSDLQHPADQPLQILPFGVAYVDWMIPGMPHSTDELNAFP